MSTAVENVEKILTTEFEIDNFVGLVRELFSNIKIIAPDKAISGQSNFFSHIKTHYHVGNYETPESEKIGVFAVELQNKSYVENARSTQRSYAKKLIENGNFDAALLAFYMPGEKKWRLSFVVLDYEMKIENGKMKTEENLTPARRYSYLVGEDEPCHTAISRFGKFIRDNDSQPTLAEMEDAFSVEAVTKEFFDLYCEKFYQLVEYLESNEAFKGESERCGFSTEQFAKKLMGQIVFLYFLQKKGWLGVGVWVNKISEKEYKDIFYTSRFSAAQKEQIQKYLPVIYVPFEDGYRFKGLSALESIPDDVEENIANAMPGDRNWGSGSKTFLRTWFDWAARHDGKFYDNYLEPLFYATLNKNRGDLGYSTILHCRVPFLSGGLFDPIDGYDWEHTNFNIPDEIFSNKKSDGDLSADGILDIFDRYNFTMSEDEPMEREVAIDPEMLGKVFENLLDVKDRKSKGAFYTPREIVHYMCQESLVNYLTTNIDISEDAIRSFILYGDFYKDTDTEKTLKINDANGKYHMEFDINRELKISPEIFDPKSGVDKINEIDKLLENIRVADPAVGSGAFPLGMLNEIVRARQNCSAYMATKMSTYNARLMYVNERSAHNLKYETIKNCIFAADIEPSAVDIAQLRLWLALVIDDEINPNAQGPLDGHRNPLPLPNLECNIVCGNSLVDELDGYRLIPQNALLGTEIEGQEFSWNQNELEQIIPKLVDAQDRLFRCDDPTKKEQYKNEIQAIKDTMIHSELEVLSPASLKNYELNKAAASKPYVLWQIDFSKVFKEKGGFDVVIGNPPYVGESGHKDIFRPIAATEFGKKYYQGKMDLFYFFFHKGIDLLKRDGNIALITTNYYPTATGAKNLRTDFKTRTCIRKMIDFNEVKVFESAQGQHNMITFLCKTDNKEKFTCQSIQCSESFLATSNQILDILKGEDKSVNIAEVEQANLYDGPDSYIRPRGVKSTSANSNESVLEKIASAPFLVKDVAEVNQGVLTGCDTLTNRHLSKMPSDTLKVKNDGIFVLDFEVARDKEVADGFNNGRELLKDFYKNSDIERYICSDVPTKKLIYYTGELDSEKYPDVYSHMLSFKSILEERLVTYNEKYHWTAIHRPRNGKVFEKNVPKIVVPYRTKTNSFAYNEIEWFCRSDCYVITSKNDKLKLKALLAMLNSDTYFFWLYYRGKRKGEVLELFQKPLSEIPIYIPDEQKQIRLAELADIIMDEKKKDKKAETNKYEEEINEIVYGMFQFSEEEKSLIRSLSE